MFDRKNTPTRHVNIKFQVSVEHFYCLPIASRTLKAYNSSQCMRIAKLFKAVKVSCPYVLQVYEPILVNPKSTVVAAKNIIMYLLEFHCLLIASLKHLLIAGLLETVETLAQVSPYILAQFKYNKSNNKSNNTNRF